MSGAGAGALRWLWLSAAVLVADQASKAVAIATLEVHRPVALAPFLDLTLTHNPGAAFSLLGDAGGWQRWLFVALAIAVTAFLVSWLRQVRAGERLVPGALALIIGGAIGNLGDRLFRDGRVVDFVDLHYGDWHWPAFNVADSAICVGAAVLIATAFRRDAG